MARSTFFQHRWLVLVGSSALLTACASGMTRSGDDGASPGAGGSGGPWITAASGGAGGPRDGEGGAGSGVGGSGGAVTVVEPQACPPGEFVQRLDADGKLVCAPIDAPARDAVNSECAVYLGQRDRCEGCSDGPTKWGSVSGETCTNGAGEDSTCGTALLGERSVTLFGLNTDGDVDDNDTLYLGFHCGEGSAASAPGPCGAGSFASGFLSSGDLWCAPASGVVLGYVREHCSLFLGQRDHCDGCATPPARWGRAGTGGCDPGSGAGNRCITVALGAASVTLLGLDLDGDVDDNDTLFVGLRCVVPEAAETVAEQTCPPGQLVAGIEAGGALRCQSPAAAALSHIAERCALTFGARDGCDACTLAPARWGEVRDGGCTNGAGAGNTCSAAVLGGTPLQLFGLDLDGDVDDNDKLYAGLRCD